MHRTTRHPPLAATCGAQEAALTDPASLPANAPLQAAALAGLSPGWLSLTGRPGYVEDTFRDEFAAALDASSPPTIWCLPSSRRGERLA